MKTILAAVIVAGMVAADLSYAQSGADVVKTKGCLACHAVDQKKVGPSYKDLAAKYSGDTAGRQTRSETERSQGSSEDCGLRRGTQGGGCLHTVREMRLPGPE
jgi:cytochrome c